MICSQCGESIPDEANFCPSCGTPLMAEVGGSDSTTGSIEAGELDPQHEVGEFPTLEPGTGMLVVVRGPNAGSRFLLDRERTSVGRHPESDIFLDDVTVSRRHAVLSLGDEGVTVEDNGSLNGTYVNGERVDVRALATGDELQIGRFKLLFVGDPTVPIGDAS
ncbi:MAG: FHA domain-containing protein [Nitriliruptoraceae bacterium]